MNAKPNLKLQARFDTPEEVEAVEQIAKYLRMSTREFLRRSALQGVIKVQEMIREAQKKAEEGKVHDGNPTTLQPETTDTETLSNSENTDSVARTNTTSISHSAGPT